MAVTNLAVQKPGITGLTLSFTAANVDGHSIINDGSTLLYVKNGGGSSITLTFDTPGKVSGVDIANPTVTVVNASEKIVGPFNPAVFGQSDGTVVVTFSGVTSVTCAAISAAA